MAQPSKQRRGKIVASGDLASAQRTIGGILGQFHAVGVGRTRAVATLAGVGLPEIAFDDPSFPISLRQDFELLNEIRKRLPPGVSSDASLFTRMHGTRANMMGVLGMAWQSAPTVRDAVNAVFSFPHANWGRCRVVVRASSREERIVYALDRGLPPPNPPEDIAGTHRYAMLLDLTAGLAMFLDILGDRSLLREVHLPFETPDDWAPVARTLPFEVRYDCEEAAIVLRAGCLDHVPRRAHEISFRLAMKLVGKESALLAEDSTFRERVARWLWSSSPPPSKTEISRQLGLSERSLTRRLGSEGVTFNALYTEVQGERAQNLLSNPRLKISEVAYRMGYSEPAAFTRAFVGWVGVTPSQWRQQQ